jgi:hypothetical protein
MCLTFKTNVGVKKLSLPTEAKVAKKNIICYKQLFRTDISLHMDFKYEKGKLNKPVNISINECNEIEEGYHSFVERKDMFSDPVNRIFVIPKGSIYYEGFDNGYPEHVYVSETIVFIDELTYWNLFKLKVKLFLGVQLWSKNS